MRRQILGQICYAIFDATLIKIKVPKERFRSDAIEALFLVPQRTFPLTVPRMLKVLHVTIDAYKERLFLRV